MDRHKHTPNMTPKSCKREVINTGIIKVKSVRRRTRQLRKPVSSRYRMIKDILPWQQWQRSRFLQSWGRVLGCSVQFRHNNPADIAKRSKSLTMSCHETIWVIEVFCWFFFGGGVCLASCNQDYSSICCFNFFKPLSLQKKKYCFGETTARFVIDLVKSWYRVVHVGVLPVGGAIRRVGVWWSVKGRGPGTHCDVTIRITAALGD